MENQAKYEKKIKKLIYFFSLFFVLDNNQKSSLIIFTKTKNAFWRYFKYLNCLISSEKDIFIRRLLAKNSSHLVILKSKKLQFKNLSCFETFF